MRPRAPVLLPPRARRARSPFLSEPGLWSSRDCHGEETPRVRHGLGPSLGGQGGGPPQHRLGQTCMGQEGQKERPSWGMGGELLRGGATAPHSQRPITQHSSPHRTKGTEGSPLGWSPGREARHVRGQGWGPGPRRRTCSRQRLLPSRPRAQHPTTSRGAGCQKRLPDLEAPRPSFKSYFQAHSWGLASQLSSGGHGSSEGCGEDGPAQTLHMQTDHNTNSHLGESLTLPQLPQPGTRFCSPPEGSGLQPGGRSSKHGGHKTESARGPGRRHSHLSWPRNRLLA